MDIGIWGDSITYGECDSEGLGWVGRVRKSFPIDEYVGVYNRGICGDTSQDLLKRFAVEVESIAPATIVLAIGINDSKYPKGEEQNLVNLEQFKENVQALVTRAKAHAKNVYVVGCTSVDEAPRPSGTRFSNEQIKQYSKVLQNVASIEDLQFIGVSSALDIATDLYDGLHPNAVGYEKLAKVIGPRII